MRASGAKVEAHIDHFAINAPDTEWLPDVSQRGWVVITKDWGLTSNLLEQRAIAASNAKVFILSSGNYTGTEMATVLVKALKRLQKFARGNQPPFIARVNANGQVRMHQNKTKLLKLVKGR